MQTRKHPVSRLIKGSYAITRIIFLRTYPAALVYHKERKGGIEIACENYFDFVVEKSRVITVRSHYQFRLVLTSSEEEARCSVYDDTPSQFQTSRSPLLYPLVFDVVSSRGVCMCRIKPDSEGG
ncbi:hypothetical protein QE152_g29276 [Popillia japonica]|uniref:Uncharacterized protein n=1 Tax=Popillia japonica TaxID=7064 RepID=A0AAW1JHI9_POPJA